MWAMVSLSGRGDGAGGRQDDSSERYDEGLTSAFFPVRENVAGFAY